MPFLPGLAVIFAGLLGGGGRVDTQVESAVHRAGARTSKMPAAKLKALTHRSDGFRDIVRSLHADGVIACEVITGHGAPSLRVVVYDGDGGLKSFSETPLAAGSLSSDDLAVLIENFDADVASLTPDAPAPKPEVVVAPVAKPAPIAPIVPKPVAKPAPEPMIVMDDEDPLASSSKKPASPKAIAIATNPTPAPTKAKEPVADEPAPAADEGDGVSVADIEALTAGTDSADSAGAPSAAPNASSLGLGASAGVGITGRNFAPGPVTMPGYSANAVGAFRLDAHVRPTAMSKLAVSAERTIAMTTQMGTATDAASTTIGRWEATASRSLVRGRFELAGAAGIGRRTFSIASDDTARTPDSNYNYLVLGANAGVSLGSHVTLRTNAAFEPVVSGAEPTEMAFGEARRWGLDVGASLDVNLGSHLVLRATADYQQFMWSWDDAGARGAGGAVDAYPSGALSLGAEY